MVPLLIVALLVLVAVLSVLFGADSRDPGALSTSSIRSANTYASLCT